MATQNVVAFVFASILWLSILRSHLSSPMVCQSRKILSKIFMPIMIRKFALQLLYFKVCYIKIDEKCTLFNNNFDWNVAQNVIYHLQCPPIRAVDHFLFKSISTIRVNLLIR